MFVSLSVVVMGLLFALAQGHFMEEIHDNYNQRVRSFKAATTAATMNGQRSKLRSQNFGGTEPGNYIVETWFNGPVCGGVDPELTLYKANACLAFYDEGGVRRFMKNECFVDTKMGQRSYYVDEACTIPDSTWTTDVGPADTCLGSVVLSCQFDASILRNVRHSEMFVLFEDQAAMEANNLPSAKMFIIDAPTSTLRNLKDSQKMSCNSKIGYGHCVDTTNAESYARLQLSFQTNAVSLYSKRNGLGKVSRVELPPSSKEQDGDVMALRFPVRDWYDVYFGPTGPQTMVDLAEVDVADI